MIRNWLAIVLTITLVGCAQKDPQQTSTQTNYKENVSNIIAVESKAEQTAPNFTWSNEKGEQVSFAEFSKGKPVLINFWATWCGPCIKEMPDLVALSDEYAAKGGLVIGISVDKDSDALTLVSDFTKEYNVQYPIIIDNGDLEKAFGGMRGIPATFFVDKKGKIVKKLIGFQSKEKFAKEFNALL